jgi:hypothetical protein
VGDSEAASNPHHQDDKRPASGTPSVKRKKYKTFRTKVITPAKRDHFRRLTGTFDRVNGIDQKYFVTCCCATAGVVMVQIATPG